jgi:hypothetical protein
MKNTIAGVNFILAASICVLAGVCVHNGGFPHTFGMMACMSAYAGLLFIRGFCFLFIKDKPSS